MYNFSVALKPLECEEGSKFQFQKPIEFNSATLTKLIPAVNPNYYCINIWFNNENDLEIWGFSEKSYPHFTFSTSSSGKIILDCFLGLKNNFKSFISMPETGFISLKSHPSPVADWLWKSPSEKESLALFERNADLGDILSNMFSHGNGGAICLVPRETDKWKESIQQPVLYESVSPYQDTRISEKYSTIENYLEERMEAIGGNSLEEKIEGLLTSHKPNEKLNFNFALNRRKANDAFSDIGNLTKVDGATVLSRDFEVFRFWSKDKIHTYRPKTRQHYSNYPF